jgi:uncharacterized membrane protein HdeD (DUF308 family)
MRHFGRPAGVQEGMMIDRGGRGRWVLALRGVAAILFGLAAFLVPESALVGLVLLFAAYLVIDGIFAVLAGLVIEGVLGLAAGIVIALWPALSLLFFIKIAALWAILSGVALLWAARGRGLMLVGGVLSLLWGLLVLFEPMAGVVVWAWWIGAYALAFGVVMLAAAYRLGRSVT